VSVPERIELGEELLEVGRVEPADVVLPVPTVSGRHALLRLEDDGLTVTVTDLGSTNGTVVQGEELGGMQSVRLGRWSRRRRP
jgi:pSer/pThr/pTyr-binding forkhead associated (FHA) protein